MSYWGWRVASGVLGRLPLGVAYRLAAVIGWAAFWCWPRGRRAMLENYGRVMPGASRRAIRRVAQRSLIGYCEYLVDFARFAGLTAEEMVAHAQGEESFQALGRVLAEEGRGVVFGLMHFGNWDVGAGATAARGFPVTTVVETFSDARLDAAVTGARERAGMTLVRMERVGPALFRALKGNAVLALLIDRPVPGDGVRVTFFGEEVEVPGGAARMALRTGARPATAAFRRIVRGRPEVLTLTDFDLKFAPTGDLERDVQALTQAMMHSHERFIRESPEQWYMFRRFWAGAGG